MNIASYSGHDIQMFLSMLNQLESSGVTDIRFARAAIQRRLDEQASEIKSRMRRDRRGISTRPLPPPVPCPSCGTTALQPTANDEGLKIMTCKKCRYGEVQTINPLNIQETRNNENVQIRR